MKNHWIRMARKRQFNRVEEFLNKNFAELLCSFGDQPGGGEKLFVKQSGLHICTIIRNSEGWRICYYAGDRKNYRDEQLPGFNDPKFWGIILRAAQQSSSIMNKPETIIMK